MREKTNVLFKALMKDSLTGFNTRTYFDISLKGFLERQFNCTNIAVIFGDYNFMKFSNERYGYKRVDAAIRIISKGLLKEADKILENYYPIRYGGDEICFIAWGKDEDAIKKFVQNAKAVIENLPYERKLGLSLALDYEMKNSYASLDEVIKTAQKRMKKDKERMQSCSENDPSVVADLLIPTIQRMVHREDMENFIYELSRRLIDEEKDKK